MVSAAEIMVLIGIVIGVAGAIFVPGVPQKRLAALIGIVLFIVGTAFGGLVWAGVPASIEIPGVSPPTAKGLYDVSFLTSSDTDRTEAGELISDGGATIRYTLSDANMDGLGDVNLDVRVVNRNVGDAAAAWPFEVSLAFVDSIAPSTSPTRVPIVNRTSAGTPNERYDVTYTLTDSGSPTLNQDGERAFSNDWYTGLADTLNIDLTMAPTVLDDLGNGAQVQLRFLVGGVTMTCILQEGAA